MLQSKLKPLALSLALLGITCIHTLAYAENKAEALEAGTVDVVSTTPLPSIGTPINQVPANVQVASDKSLVEQKSLDLNEFMDNNMGSVTTNDTVSNPYQSDVIYRGFTASPLLGTPQGLSVFVDGVRVNEPFGDIVNWDLIPVSAIANINLIPGSNPLFGLNTLGGALSVHTKSGDEYPGTSITVTGGSWGRAQTEFETGGKRDNLDYFLTGNLFHEDGWRDHSASDVRQLFGKLGWQDDKNDLDLSVMLADNDMHGTQALPQVMLSSPESAFTWPDSIKNKMEMVTLKGSHYFADDKLVSAETYFRHNKADGFNSNVNNNFDNTLPLSSANPAATNAISSTDTDGFGGSVQMTLLGDLMSHKNQFTGGVSADYGRTDFNSDTLIATVVGSQTVTQQPVTDPQRVRLQADSDYYGLFATDTFSITDKLHVTASARYNIAYVSLRGSSLDDNDATLVPGDLNGDHTYSRLNPALGFNYNVSDALGFYVGYNEGTRAPSPIELACADPNHPCAVPNAFGGDPDLQQVVSRTWEGGVRGHLGDSINWNAGVFTTQNSNDIAFIASGTSGNGFFQNVGDTLREGLELGMNGKMDKLSFAANYSYIDATFRTPFTEASSGNSSADGAGNIQVNKGDSMPGVPHHTLKLRFGYAITTDWIIGTNIFATSSQYARGDENNQDGNGKIPGYTVVNLDTSYSINDHWKVFAKVENLFDKNYSTFGLLGTNEFVGPGNSYTANNAAWNNNAQFRTPAPPRAAWVGLTYEFDKPKGSATKADD